YVVLGRLDPKLLLQLAKFLRLLGCQIVGLAEVLRDVVEFPFVIVDVDGFANGPRWERWRRRCNPTIAVYGAIGEHLEILSAVRRWGLRIVEGIHHAHTLDRS